MHLPGTFFFPIWVKWLEPIGMKFEEDFSFNINLKQSLHRLTRIILRMWSDTLLAGIWIYNFMYLTHFPSKWQLKRAQAYRYDIFPYIYYFLNVCIREPITFIILTFCAKNQSWMSALKSAVWTSYIHSIWNFFQQV